MGIMGRWEYMIENGVRDYMFSNYLSAISSHKGALVCGRSLEETAEVLD